MQRAAALRPPAGQTNRTKDPAAQPPAAAETAALAEGRRAAGQPTDKRVTRRPAAIEHWANQMLANHVFGRTRGRGRLCSHWTVLVSMSSSPSEVSMTCCPLVTAGLMMSGAFLRNRLFYAQEFILYFYHICSFTF